MINNVIYQPAPSSCQLAKRTRHRVKYTVILGFLALFATAPVFAEGDFEGGGSSLTRMVKEMATASVPYPEMGSLANYPAEVMLVNLATENASTRLVRAAGSTNPSDLQPLVSTSWLFTYTVGTKTYTATISCGGASAIVAAPDGTAGLACTTPQNEVVGAAYDPTSGQYVIVVNNTLQDWFVFKLQGCCSASGSYYAYAIDSQLQHPYPLTGTRIDTVGTNFVSTNRDDLQPLVNTSWQFTYTVGTQTYTATVSCGSTFTTPPDGGFILNCTTPQNEEARAGYLPAIGEYIIVVINTLQDAFRFKLQGCCSASGSYHAYAIDNQLQYPYPLTGTGTKLLATSRDFDGDGIDDILWSNKATGDLFLYTSSHGNYPAGNVPVDTGWMVRGVFDYDKDGRADILWWNQKTGEVYVWLGNGSKGSLGTVADTQWKPCCGGDLNGDGFGDVLWYHQTTGELYVWYSGGAKVPLGVTVDPNTGWRPKGVADFDGDNFGDVLWWNEKTGDLFFGESYPGVPIGTGWMAAGAGDFDRDGKADILWWNQKTGEVYIWDNGGKGARHSRGLVPDLNWSPR